MDFCGNYKYSPKRQGGNRASRSPGNPLAHNLLAKKKGTLLPSMPRGETGIRTLEARKGLTVFETAPFGHSGISPSGSPLALALMATVSNRQRYKYSLG